jgi:oligogalacturonide transporter
MTEIAHLKSGARSPTSEDSRQVVEDLSGWPYDKLWGNNSVGVSTKSPQAQLATGKE